MMCMYDKCVNVIKCPLENIKKTNVYSKLAVDSNLCYLTYNKLTEILLYGSFLFNTNQNRSILYSSMTYIMDLK